jgi:type I restriction enzyme S subunit
VWEGDEPVAVHDACYIFKHNQYPRFISHYLRTLDYHLQIKKNVSTAKICAISPEGIAKAKIALPPLEEQKRIADFLDKFEVLLNSLSDGIPAEQAAQQKRYEYYRDLLLTFDRKAV